MKRYKMVVANWKMNLTVPESSLLLERLVKLVKVDDTEVVVCPSFLAIYTAQETVKHADISLGSQDAFYEDLGAYTGAVSAHQLKGFVNYAILGHSERRKYFNETDKQVAQKASVCFRNNIKPIICVGESLHERNDGLTKVVISGQTEACLYGLTPEEVASTVIAYEPLWAIGTGHVCDPKKANEVAKNIRSLVKVLYGEATAQKLRIIYGGSVDSKNVADFSSATEVDGFLVGGSSLDYKELTEIINTVDAAPIKPQKTTNKKKVIKKKAK